MPTVLHKGKDVEPTSTGALAAVQCGHQVGAAEQKQTKGRQSRRGGINRCL